MGVKILRGRDAKMAVEMASGSAPLEPGWSNTKPGDPHAEALEAPDVEPGYAHVRGYKPGFSNTPPDDPAAQGAPEAAEAEGPSEAPTGGSSNTAPDDPAAQGIEQQQGEKKQDPAPNKKREPAQTKTVKQLRDEAKAQGIEGASGMKKAELEAALAAERKEG